MTKQQKSIRTQITFKDISMTRRHVYFYLLLFLVTALLHNSWKSSTPDAAAQAIKAGEQVAEVQHELALAEQRFAP